MPRFDGTGPEGKGSKTGRGAGNCGEKKPLENKENWLGLFSRRRSGRRMGLGNRGKTKL